MCWRWGLLALALLMPTAWAGQRPIDSGHSQLGFEIRTRYGQLLKGRFPVFSGYLEVLPDGRHQVSLVVDAAQAEIPGHQRYTRWLRGEDFFDARHHPQILYRSQPHLPTVAVDGGLVDGVLILRGVPGLVEMAVEPAACRRAGYDCPVSGRGTVSRAAYGMDSWQFAVSDRVTFVLQVRLAGADPT
jgi:polyisoprenoid-binding protein YceI